MSTLLHQLQHLKVAGQPSSLSVTAKKRPSLLFDHEEAAAIDIEVIYDLGRNGLEELIKIDDSLNGYEENLFSEKCMSYERSIQGKEQLKQLDDTIARFLRQLSPYLMLRAAHKCMEWLIRVFRINSYNVDSIMECILPYHDTVLFARILQLLPLKSKSSAWHWLRPAQKKGSPLAKSTLTQHCISVPAFLSFVCSMVDRCSNKVAVNFYCSTVVSVLSTSAVPEESLVVMVIPHITNGLKSSYDHIKAANYIILAHMIQRTTLSDKVSNSLLNILTKNLSESLMKEGLMLLCNYCNYQQLKTLPSRTVKYLAGCPQLLPTLSELVASHDVSTFGKLLITSLITSQFDKMIGSLGDQVSSPDMVVGVFKTVPLEEAIVVQCGRLLLECYMKHRDVIGQNNEDDASLELDQLEHYCGPIIKLIDTRYPSVMDIVIGSHMTSCDPFRQKWVQDFVALSLRSLKHHVVMDTSVVTAVGIHHGNSQVRKSTLSNLCQQISNTMTEDVEDKEFILSAVLSHLRDDSNIVVENAVSCCVQQEKMLWYIPVDPLTDALFSVLSRARSHDPVSKKCLLNVISLLSSVDQFTDSMLLRLLPHLLYQYHDDIQVIQSLGVAIATSSLSQTHPILVGSDKLFCSQAYQIQSSDSDVMNDANCHLIGYVAERLSSMETHHLITMIDLLLDMSHHDDSISVFFKPSFLFSVATVTQLLMYSLPSSLNIKICTNLVSMVSSIVPHCVLENVTPSLYNTVIILVHRKRSQRKHGRCLGNLVSWIITMVTEHLVIITDRKASLWLDMSSCDPVDYQRYCVVLLMLYNLLIWLLSNSSHQCIDNCHSIMKTFINIHFQGRGTLLRFLAMIWCAQPDVDLDKLSLFNLHTQISCLRYALIFLEAMGPGDLLAVGGVPQCPMVPALLVALLKPDKSLRQAALKCFQLIHASIDVTGVNVMNVDTPFLYLCDVILHHQVELEADHNAVLIAMAKGMDTVTMATNKSIISAVVKALMHHVTSHDTPTHIQHSLLIIISNVYHKVKVDGVMKMLKRKLDNPSSSDDQSSDKEVIEELIKCYNVNNTTFITNDAINLLTRLLDFNHTILNLVLQQITGEFYASLMAHHQQLILSTLLDHCLLANTAPAVSAAIVNVINKLPLNINNVLNELDKKQLLIKEKSVGSKKSKRIKLDTPTREEMSVDKSWQRVGIILDAIPGSVSSHDCYQLVQTLFELLESCLELDTTLHHIQLQLLIVLCWIVTMTMAHIGVEKARELLPESQFNVDLIIQTIRSSSSTPQIQQQSLTLLSQSASLYPVRILHNIMPIFTFMGSYLSNHDDQYSFKIVLNAMDSLLPMLMSSDTGHTPKKLSNQIAVTTVEIIRVFSDAIQHIPNHRQLMVFEKLVNILGADEYLHVTLLMLLGKQVAKQQLDNQEKKMISEFCKQLSNEFPIVTQVMSLHKVMEYISHLPDVQAVRTGSARKIAMVTAGEIFNLYTHSTKQIQQYKLFALSSVISILSCDQFTNKLVSNGVSKEQEMVFISLLQTTISYIVTINAHHTTGKFYDLLMKRCYSIVDHVTHPLATKSYIKVMSQLIMPGAHSDIQRRSLNIICSHFTSSSRYFGSSNVTDTLTLLPLLNQLIQHKQLPSDNMVSAISLITAIIQAIGSGYHDTIIEVIPHLLKMIKKKSTPNQVLACSIKCVSKLIRNIGGHFIPHLPNTLPLLTAKVSSHDSSITIMAIDGLISVIEVLPKFLTPYLSDIVVKGCHATIATGSLITVTTAAEHLREQLATHVPSRMLIPKLLQCYNQVASIDTMESILSFLHILRMSINKLSTTDVSSYSSELTDLFLKLLQYRSTQQQEVVVDVEDKCVECFTELVVKMSENTFRPVFLKISDWATQSKNKDHMISFYHLADQIAGKLKGLFLLFAGHIIPNCVELLSSISDDDHQLQQYLLSCLTKCFHYDTTNSFLTNNRFNALLKPLVTQVHMVSDDDAIHNYLVPCFTEFAAATSVDTHWKDLNHQLLLYSKDDSSKVRQSVLHILMALYNKLGESLLILLPETIPFLAELLEDEDEEVEQLCRKFIKIVEELLGESIQQYF